MQEGKTWDPESKGSWRRVRIDPKESHPGDQTDKGKLEAGEQEQAGQEAEVCKAPGCRQSLP